MIEQHWKVEKQPAWLVAAIRKTIAGTRVVLRVSQHKSRPFGATFLSSVICDAVRVESVRILPTSVQNFTRPDESEPRWQNFVCQRVAQVCFVKRAPRERGAG